MNAPDTLIAIGLQVTYLAGRRQDHPRRLCRRGIVTGTPIVDDETATTLIPVCVDGRGTEDAPEWVRTEDIIDVRPAS